MAEHNSTFRHEPLEADQIRLLQVIPGPNDPIICEIEAYDQHATPEYTCLSYMWKRTPTDTDQCTIQLNGSPYEIGQNLADFLHIAQRKYSGVYFWIDALCIDQDDLEERNDQVRKMGQIYSEASRTVAWLGQSDGVENLEFNNQSWRPRLSRQKSSGMTSQEAAIFTQIVSHKYWSRTWIVQEQRFSKQMEILLGDARLTATRLAELNDIAARLVKVHGRDRSQILPFERVAQSLILGDPTKKYPMVELLKLYHNTSCSDARDKVYALLAMAEEGSEIHVDYASTLVNLALDTISACRNNFCMCLPALLFRTFDIERIEEKLQYHRDTLVQIIFSCPWRRSSSFKTQSVLRTCKCEGQAFLSELADMPDNGAVLCLKTICGFGAGAHMLLGDENVIHWNEGPRSTPLRKTPLVTSQIYKGRKTEMVVTASFTPLALYELTHASVIRMTSHNQLGQELADPRDLCQKLPKSICYRVVE